MINIRNNLLIFFFPFFLFANQGVFEWASMTSLINATDIIKDSNGNILATTNGGVLLLKDNELEILKEDLNNFDLEIVGLDRHGLTWFAGTFPNGNIQVFNFNQNSIYITDYLGIDSIIDIAFHNSKVFAAYTKGSEIGILEFNYDEQQNSFLFFYIKIEFVPIIGSEG